MPERTSENGGVDWFYEGEEHLNEQQAKEQLLWSLRRQLGTITFETIENEDERERGTGVVIAKINGEEVDHYIYYEEE